MRTGEPPTNTPLRVECRYDTSWPGPKTVRAYSRSQDCIGEATLRVNVMKVTNWNPYPHSFFVLGYVPSQTLCGTVPGITTPLRPVTLINTKTTNPDPRVKINFGCLLNGCVYDAEGEPNSSVPISFPFPGMRKYSLILEVGNVYFQGGTGVTNNDYRIQRASGLLKVCVNDDSLDDNTGAWQIVISVDGSQGALTDE